MKAAFILILTLASSSVFGKSLADRYRDQARGFDNQTLVQHVNQSTWAWAFQTPSHVIEEIKFRAGSQWDQYVELTRMLISETARGNFAADYVKELQTYLLTTETLVPANLSEMQVRESYETVCGKMVPQPGSNCRILKDNLVTKNHARFGTRYISKVLYEGVGTKDTRYTLATRYLQDIGDLAEINVVQEALRRTARVEENGWAAWYDAASPNQRFLILRDKLLAMGLVKYPRGTQDICVDSLIGDLKNIVWYPEHNPRGSANNLFQEDLFCVDHLDETAMADLNKKAVEVDYTPTSGGEDINDILVRSHLVKFWMQKIENRRK